MRIFHWKKDGFSYLLALWAKSLLTSAKHLRQGFRNFNLRVRRKSLREEKMKKNDFLVILCFKSNKNWTLGKTVWQGLSKLHLACPEESFEHFFGKKQWFLNDFCTLSEKVRDFAKSLRQGFRKFNLRVRKKSERETKLKKRRFLSIFVFWAKKMDSGRSNWAGVVKTTFGVCEDFSLKKGWFFISSCTVNKIIVDFCQIFMAEFPKLQFTCPEKFFERKKNDKNMIS